MTINNPHFPLSNITVGKFVTRECLSVFLFTNAKEEKKRNSFEKFQPKETFLISALKQSEIESYHTI